MNSGNEKTGWVVWITGLPGAGKTTIATHFAVKLRDNSRSPILLDGDQLRDIFQIKLYDRSSRQKLAQTYARLSHVLAQQGHDVVCSTVSMFHSVRAWNRNHIGNYYEVFVKASDRTLHERDQKNLYSTKEFPTGTNSSIELPESPDLVIDNEGGITPELAAERLWKEFTSHQMGKGMPRAS